MIRVSVDYTDDLGPEADIPALRAKIAARLSALGPPGAPEHLLVESRALADFARSEGGWETLHIRVRAAPALAETFRGGLLDELLALAELHLADLSPRRSIALAADLETPLESAERMRPRPASAPSF